MSERSNLATLMILIAEWLDVAIFPIASKCLLARFSASRERALRLFNAGGAVAPVMKAQYGYKITCALRGASRKSAYIARST